VGRQNNFPRAPNFDRLDRTDKDAMQQFIDVDWSEVLERLTLESLRLFNASCFAEEERVLASFGDGFEDLAQEVILELLDEQNPKVTWSTARGPATTAGVTAYLRVVLRNDFYDRVRRKRLRKQRSIVSSTVDDDDVTYLVDPADPARSAEDMLIVHERVAPLRQRLNDDCKVRPDEDLQLYLMLQFDGDEYVPYTPKDAAKELGIDVKQVYLLKDKLERRINRLFKEEIDAARAEAHERPYEKEAR
jgi:DNA-directed RNA polymerase specialized sigma24 family protein